MSNNYILVYNIEDSSSYTKLRFNKYRQYYGFNYNKCLITDQIEIVRIDNHCNPHILYEDCEYSCYTSHRNEIIIEDNWTCRGRQLKYYLYNLEQKNGIELTNEDYFLIKKEQRGFAISKHTEVFTKFPFK